jgi:hypothetical protein
MMERPCHKLLLLPFVLTFTAEAAFAQPVPQLVASEAEKIQARINAASLALGNKLQKPFSKKS